jgi:PadR family transcriptional regulator, regulatory protein PadR
MVNGRLMHRRLTPRTKVDRGGEEVSTMDKNIRLSAPTLKVLRLFLEQPREARSGAEISRVAGVGPGTLYPLLARLEMAAWLISRWEQVDPTEVGRPRRRFYTLTNLGQSEALKAFRELQFVPGELVWTS